MRKLIKISLASLTIVVSLVFISGIALAQTGPNHINHNPSTDSSNTSKPTPTTSGSGTDTQQNPTTSTTTSNTPPPAPADLPQDEGTVTPTYTVTSATLVIESASASATSTATTTQAIIFQGHAEPNIYITLYIYSTPIVVSVKTDNEGNWSYKLDQELETGEHHVYVAKVNNSGVIVARSNPIVFTKTEASVELNSSDSVPVTPQSVNFLQQYFWWIAALILVVILIITITIVGFSTNKAETITEGTPDKPQGPNLS